MSHDEQRLYHARASEGDDAGEEGQSAMRGRRLCLDLPLDLAVRAVGRSRLNTVNVSCHHSAVMQGPPGTRSPGRRSAARPPSKPPPGG